MSEAIEHHECPFDTRLARTPYLVLPKLALQAMPMEWRLRFDAMLGEMEAAGIDRTPSYLVLRDATMGDPLGCAVQDQRTGFIRIIRKPVDPWAEYRHATADDVRALCPDYRRPA